MLLYDSYGDALVSLVGGFGERREAGLGGGGGGISMKI